MELYRFLCNINFEGKKFKVFSDNNFKKTFLRVLEDDSLCYADLEDYIKLNQIYNVHNANIVCGVNFQKFKAGAIFAGRLLLATALALEIPTIVDSQSIQNFDDTQKTVVTQFTEDSNGTIWIEETQNHIFVKNNDEFRQYVENPNPTFANVREAIENNQNLDNNVKNLLKEYINKVEKCYPDIDLCVFYYNVKRLDIEYVSKEKLIQMNAGAYYNSYEGTINFLQNEEINKHDAFHEFTHMFSEAQIINDEKSIFRSSRGWTYDELGNCALEIGRAYGEGIDEVFLVEVFGPELGLEHQTVYREFTDIVYMFTEFGFSITDMQESNIRYIIEELEKIGVKDAKHIIELMDAQEFTSSDIEIEKDLRIEIYLLCFENLAEQKLKEGQTPEQVYDNIVAILANGYIQKYYGYSYKFLPEQKILIEKTIEMIQEMLGIEGKIPVLLDKPCPPYAAARKTKSLIKRASNSTGNSFER